MIEDDEGAATTALAHTRKVTIDALCEHFANDAMTVEEFERRVDTAHSAASVDELRELLRDLPGGGLPALAGEGGRGSGQGYSIARPGDVRDSGYSVAILGGSRRVGRWSPARRNTAIAFCGGVELDFREAVMPPGVTEVRVFAMWGGVEVIVPPGMNVECDGVGIMGGFDHAAARPVDPAAAILRVTGVALMGGVEVTVRHLGESGRDARRRRRQERRERAREFRRDRRLGGRSEFRADLREDVEDIGDAARDVAGDVKRPLRGGGSGPG